MSQRLARFLRTLRRPPPVEVWVDDAYRIPLPSLETSRGVEPRRVEFATWTLLDRGAVRPEQFRTPTPIHYADVLRVHAPDYVESLQRADVLAGIFGVEPSEVPVEPLLRMVRLAAGATLQAARSSLERRGHALNLSGGFHHAAPARGAGFSPINDLAIAVATLRAEGFDEQVAILDLDAHPPDGTAECLAGDRKCWIGSISGSRWKDLGNVDDVVVRDRAGDDEYLDALDGLLRRMPDAALALVVAGGDVLADDRYGRIGLTLDGARRRDRRVFAALRDVPSVWTPGGGYHPDAWRILAGTGLVLAGRARTSIPRAYDPLRARFASITASLSPEALRGDLEFTDADVEGDLAQRSPPTPRLLGFYTVSGLEYALYRVGVLGHVYRLGYDRLQVEIDQVDSGGRLRLFGWCEGTRHLLIEAVLDRQRLGEDEFLLVNWLTLRNPRARFSAQRPQLPGQEVPGLGLAREATELLGLMAKRLALAGLLIRPASYHLAFAARHLFQFVDPERHGRFSALIRDAGERALVDVTHAVAGGGVRMNGEPYAWEATDYVHWLRGPTQDPDWRQRMHAERDRVRFTFDG